MDLGKLKVTGRAEAINMGDESNNVSEEFKARQISFDIPTDDALETGQSYITELFEPGKENEEGIIGTQQELFEDDEIVKGQTLKPEEVKEILEDLDVPVSANQINMFDDEDDSSIDMSKVKTDPTPPDAIPKFDPMEVQSALRNTPIEGGVVKNRSTGPTMTMRGDISPTNKDGEMLKPPPNIVTDSLIGKYEVTGFMVNYESGKNTHSVQIRDYFTDIETAFASVNGLKYLMPMPKGGYKIATISSGAPRISYNEREMYMYKENQWIRV